MCQVIRSALRGITSAWKRSSARPTGSADTRQAPQPSPNSRKLSIFSSSHCSCRCRLDSSRLTTSTLACGSERTMCRASLSAFTAAKQPMKPTMVRSTDGARPASRMMSKSSPGAVKPVQLATIRWVIAAALGRDVERGDGLARQRACRLAIQRHPGASGGECAPQIEAVAVENVIARLGSRCEQREAMLDVGEVGHAIEQREASCIGQRGAERNPRTRRGCRATAPRCRSG